MNTPKLIVVLALVFTLAMPATPVSAAGSVSITLTSPNASPVPVGSDMDVDLVFSATSVSPGVTLARVYLTYDPNLVEPLGMDPNVAVVVRPDFFGAAGTAVFSPSLIAPGPSSPCGLNNCIYLLVGGSAQSTKTGAVARFRFRVKAEGNARFEVFNPNSDTVIWDAEGSNINISLSGLPISLSVPTILRAAVGGTVLRQGNPPNRACTKVSVAGIAVFSEWSGNFTLTNLPTGVYTLKAEYPGYLYSQKSITILPVPPPPSGINAGTTTLRGGDVNNDGAVNISDIQLIISKIGQSAGVGVFPVCASPDLTLDRIDINDDLKIDLRDVAIAAGNFGQTPTNWP